MAASSIQIRKMFQMLTEIETCDPENLNLIEGIIKEFHKKTKKRLQGTGTE